MKKEKKPSYKVVRGWGKHLDISTAEARESIMLLEPLSARKKKQRKKQTSKEGESGYLNQAALERSQWKPGQSGNPKGRPKGLLNLTTQLKKLLCYKDKTGKSRWQHFLEMGLLAAESGNAAYFKYIWDRLEGAIPQEIKIEKKVQIEIYRVTAEIHFNAIMQVFNDREKTCEVMKLVYQQITEGVPVGTGLVPTTEEGGEDDQESHS